MPHVYTLHANIAIGIQAWIMLILSTGGRIKDVDEKVLFIPQAAHPSLVDTSIRLKIE